MAQKALLHASPYRRNYGNKAGFSCPYSHKRLKAKKIRGPKGLSPISYLKDNAELMLGKRQSTSSSMICPAISSFNSPDKNLTFPAYTPIGFCLHLRRKNSCSPKLRPPQSGRPSTRQQGGVKIISYEKDCLGSHVEAHKQSVTTFCRTLQRLEAPRTQVAVMFGKNTAQPAFGTFVLFRI